MEKAAEAATAAAHDSPRRRLEAVRQDRAEVIPERLAVVTGGNKGIGLEVCRQLALQGVVVILTARDKKRGKDAADSLRRESELRNLIFHQLDVRCDTSVTSLAQYIKSRYGKLDILVNNAAISGIVADEEGLKALNIDAETWVPAPGFVKTDLCWNLGVLTPEQGARGPVMLALLLDDGPTRCYFDQTEMVKVW